MRFPNAIGRAVLFVLFAIFSMLFAGCGTTMGGRGEDAEPVGPKAGVAPLSRADLVAMTQQIRSDIKAGEEAEKVGRQLEVTITDTFRQDQKDLDVEKSSMEFSGFSAADVQGADGLSLEFGMFGDLPPSQPLRNGLSFQAGKAYISGTTEVAKATYGPAGLPGIYEARGTAGTALIGAEASRQTAVMESYYGGRAKVRTATGEMVEGIIIAASPTRFLYDRLGNLLGTTIENATVRTPEGATANGTVEAASRPGE